MSDRLMPEAGSAPDAFVHLLPRSPFPPLPATADALTAPATDDLIAHVADLLPRGPAWRTPDGAAFDRTGYMAGLVRSIAAALAGLYRRLSAILPETTATTVENGLVDWEVEFGLPDACLGDDPSRAARVHALLVKVRSTGTITPADFIALAAGLGVTITITEPMPFRAGASRCGATAERVAGGMPVELIWIVRPGASEIRPFRAGLARAGTTPLGEIARLQSLECLFRRLAPAWTKVIFDYSAGA